MTRSGKPIIGVVADRLSGGRHVLHAVQEKYLDAAGAGAGAIALMLPARIDTPGGAFNDAGDLGAVLDLLDGVFLSGAVSNVAPERYGASRVDPPLPGDLARDHVTLDLIAAAIDRGMPVMGVCRGFQEINVALGGTLHQKIHEVPGFGDHRENKAGSMDEQYAPAHEVRFTPGGMLHLFTGHDRTMVNSLHGQGIDRLAPGLAIEAQAPDGVIEGFRREGEGFLLGLQWHPEWAFRDDAISVSVFRAFGSAARAYRALRMARPVTDPLPAFAG